MKTKNSLYENNYLTFSSDIPIGIELEFQGVSLNSLQKRLDIFKKRKDAFSNIWHVQRDDSVSKKSYPYDCIGGEICSPIFYNRKKDIQILKQVLQILKEEKATFGEKCSFQISIDLSLFEKNPIYFQNFCILWSLFESEIYHFSYGRNKYPRDSAYTYALPLGNHLLYYILNNLNEQKDFSSSINKLKHFLWGDGNKGYGLFLEQEIHNNGRNRIEIRPCNACFEERIILNTINFFVHLILCAKNPSTNFHNIFFFMNDFFQKEIKPYLTPFPTTLSYSSYHDTIFHAKENIKKANYLANLLYKEQKEKDLFLKQYTKKYKSF